MTDAKRRIVVVKCKAVAFEGTISFRFMFEAKVPNDKLLLDAPWGMLHRSDNHGWSLNLYKGAEGLQMGCGWDDEIDDKWDKEILDGLPSCTILMGAKAYEFWAALCAKHGVEFETHEFDGLLSAA